MGTWKTMFLFLVIAVVIMVGLWLWHFIAGIRRTKRFYEEKCKKDKAVTGEIPKQEEREKEGEEHD